MTASTKKSENGALNKFRRALSRVPSRVWMGAGVVMFAAIGAMLLVGSHAATPTANFEAEAGTVASPASAASDSGASGGQAVKFAAAATSGACPAYPAFPDATCTGVPSGYTLTTVSSLASTANGQTIDGKLVTGDLTINHDNVTVTNTRVKGVVYMGSHTGVVLKNVDVGPDACPAVANGDRFAVNGDNYTILQSHLHHIPNDILRVGGGTYTIQDSILDNACIYPGDHLDAIQWYDPGGVGTVTVAHNVINIRPINDTSNSGNATLFWADGAGQGTKLFMYQNKLTGGGISTALYDATAGSKVVLDVHDNVYVKNSYQYAPCSFGSSTHSVVFDGTSGVKYVNNKLDDGTAVTCN